MSRITILTVSAVLWLLCGLAFPQGGGKIGFVDSQEVLVGTAEGKAGLQQLDQFTAEQRKQFEAKSTELVNLQNELSTQQRSLSPDAVGRLQRTIEQKQVELRRFQEDAQARFTQAQSDLLEGISQKVQTVIEEFAKQNGYLVVFMRDQTQAYVAPTLDISQEIIRLYNERFPGQAAPAAPPSTPPSAPPQK